MGKKVELIDFFKRKKDDPLASVTCPKCRGVGCDFCNDIGEVSQSKAKKYKK